MTSTGLFTAEKLYRSARQFQWSNSRGRTQSHEPHPRGKIPFTLGYLFSTQKIYGGYLKTEYNEVSCLDLGVF
ncbi:hypothetical protein F5Y13DRAFT_164236 [Hypoxylon sp. FL1857]|nr:hypothetical protein F5Y13DRAFT_164236 [Hypoxylon sp. FL1857]